MKKKRIRRLAVNVLLLLAFFACLIASGHISGLLASQQAAKRFAGESGGRFAQLSVFLPADSSGFEESGIQALRGGLDSALTAASLEAPAGGRLYADAWSCRGQVAVSGVRGNATAEVIGVGGDFFLFHPLRLRSGGYLMADDLMRDRVLLDEELAWRLFGSVELAGLEVNIGGRPYLIAGVVAREKDFASTAAYSGEPGMYMSCEALRELTETALDCYELVMADPITGFAAGALTESLAMPEAVLVENSARYSLGSRFALLGQFGTRSIRQNAIRYPYWENAARCTEDWSALLLLLELLLIPCPLLTAVIRLACLIREAVKRGKRAARLRLEARETRAAARYRQTHRGEFEDPQTDVAPEVEEIVREMLKERE